MAAIYGYRILVIDRPRSLRASGLGSPDHLTAVTVMLAGVVVKYLAQSGLIWPKATSLVPVAAVGITVVVYTAVQTSLVTGVVALTAGSAAARAMITDVRHQ
ncbi:hypothetical protein HBB16_04320 [Pseudonocardia sp. MCCB 268]|nr:hypothetical protein [Pseudonocardia cytotoxica]